MSNTLDAMNKALQMTEAAVGFSDAAINETKQPAPGIVTVIGLGSGHGGG
jgi:hypothetical protein